MKATVHKLRPTLPGPLEGESPLAFASRLGRLYGERMTDEHRKSHGHYLTPSQIARFMGELCLDGHGPVVRLLDPAVGSGVLAAAACEALARSPTRPRRIELVAYEVDLGLRDMLEALFAHMRDWLAEHGIELQARLELRDFVLANAGALEGGILPYEQAFDAVICNPPYFKLSKADPRAQACLTVVHGQPNVYGLFMALCAATLREGGRFVFITPRSYASGPYFQRFRRWFFERIRPTELHVFESRTDAFDDVLQETVITAGYRENGWDANDGLTVRLSVSGGASDIEKRDTRELPVTDVLRGGCAHRILYLPATEAHDRVQERVAAWTGSLHAFGLEVSTGPVVAFRAKRFLRDKAGKRTVPLLWLQHIRSMSAAWPLNTRKLQHIEDSNASAYVMLPNKNYVVIRRFSAKEEARRLTAAPLLANQFKGCKRVGLENHLNYIYRTGSRALTIDETYGLAALLNSELIDTYVRLSSGNTQISATELRALPLPELAIIKRIGKRVRAKGADFEAVVAEELEHAGH